MSAKVRIEHLGEHADPVEVTVDNGPGGTVIRRVTLSPTEYVDVVILDDAAVMVTKPPVSTT